MNSKKYKIWSIIRTISFILLLLASIPLLTIGFAYTTTRIIYYCVATILLGFTLFSFLETSHYKNIATNKQIPIKDRNTARVVALVLGMALLLIVVLWLMPEIIEANS